MTDFDAVDGYYPTALRWAYFVVMDEPRMSPFGYQAEVPKCADLRPVWALKATSAPAAEPTLVNEYST